MAEKEFPGLSDKELGNAFADWTTAMQLQNWYYRSALGWSTERADDNLKTAQARLDAVMDGRRDVIAAVQEFRRKAGLSDDGPTTGAEGT